jgi:LMBR1 domain-containing protein 1
LILEIHFRRLEDAYKNQGGNFILQCAKLCYGIISGLVSTAWVLHMALYTFPKVISTNIPEVAPAAGVGYLHPFLNQFFIAISGVPVVGVAIYALFGFHWLFCVIKGVTKLGMRIFFITLHPMA